MLFAYLCTFSFMGVKVAVIVCVLRVLGFSQLLEVAISITKESSHNTTKSAHGMVMKTKAANNDSALSEKYLKVRQAELKDPV